MEEGTVIRLAAPGRAGWFEVRSAFDGSGGTWVLSAGTRLRYVGFRNSPPIGSDPLPVPHYEILSGEHSGSIVNAIGIWQYMEKE